MILMLSNQCTLALKCKNQIHWDSHQNIKSIAGEVGGGVLGASVGALTGVTLGGVVGSPGLAAAGLVGGGVIGGVKGAAALGNQVHFRGTARQCLNLGGQCCTDRADGKDGSLYSDLKSNPRAACGHCWLEIDESSSFKDKLSNLNPYKKKSKTTAYSPSPIVAYGYTPVSSSYVVKNSYEYNPAPPPPSSYNPVPAPASYNAPIAPASYEPAVSYEAYQPVSPSYAY